MHGNNSVSLDINKFIDAKIPYSIRLIITSLQLSTKGKNNDSKRGEN